MALEKLALQKTRIKHNVLTL